MKYNFKISDVSFDIESDFSIEWNPFILGFAQDEGQNASYHYRCITCDVMPAPQGHVVYQADDCTVFVMEDGREERLYRLPLYGYPLILQREVDRWNRLLYLNAAFLGLMTKPRSFRIFNALSAERLLLEKGAFVLHSSFIIHDGMAILFTAPSGTGKSTQADLWVKHQRARLINGDRTLIQKQNGVWHGCGFPICGSSDTCLNEKAPIKAVVYLEQGTDNAITPLDGSKAVKKMISEVSINFWNPHCIQTAVDLLEAFCGEVPMVHYSCTKEQEAVDVLKRYLEAHRCGNLSATESD
ncbi:MAG: hypothetical protein Q4F18_10060 [Clostridia bacterium]|nr:hypothetical protein [Clostridia bacterium]